jgi:hypothetical protein
MRFFPHPFRRTCSCRACLQYRAGFSAGYHLGHADGYHRCAADGELLAGLVQRGFTPEQANRLESLRERPS